MFNVDAEFINSPDDLTLDIVKAYMRIDHTLDDIELTLYLRSAITYVKNYISISEFTDEQIDLIIPTLMLISHFYENKTAITNTSTRIDQILSNILSFNRASIL